MGKLIFAENTSSFEESVFCQQTLFNIIHANSSPFWEQNVIFYNCAKEFDLVTQHENAFEEIQGTFIIFYHKQTR